MVSASLLLSILLLGPPVEGETLPACSQAIAEAFGQEQYLTAATAGEQCWYASRHARMLYFMANSYERARLDVHAMQAYADYIALNDDESALLEDARQALANLRARTTPINLGVSPTFEDSDDEGHVVAVLLDSEAPPLKIPLANCDGTHGFRVLRLGAGHWQLRVGRLGHRSVERYIRIEAGGAPITMAIDLEADLPPAPPPPTPGTVRFTLDRRPPRRLPVALRVEDGRGKSIDVAVHKSVLLSPGTWVVSSTHEDYRTARKEFTVAEGGRLDVELPLQPTTRTRARNVLSIAFTGLGGAFVIAGIATSIAAGRASAPESGDGPILVPRTTMRITGSGLLGAGVGLGAGAVTSRWSGSWRGPAIASAVGVAAVSSGLAWALASSARLQDVHHTTPTTLDEQRAAAGGLLMAGTTLLASSTITWLVQTVGKRRGRATERRATAQSRRSIPRNVPFTAHGSTSRGF